MLQGLFLLCTVLALSSALPHRQWHFTHYTENAVEAHHQLPESDATIDSTKPQGAQTCRSAIGELTVDGVIKRRSYHLCRQESNDPEFGTSKERDCFFTTAVCCVGDGLPHSTEKLSVGGDTVTVNFYSAEKGTDLCYSAPKNVESCLPTQCVFSCVNSDPVCLSNTLTGSNTSCDSSVCQCKPQYEPPDCCECKRGFVKFNGKCEEVCTTSCERFDQKEGCLKCRRGYTPLPKCCDCTEFFYRTADGVCKEPCLDNVLNNCENEECLCKEGFGGPDCCQCRKNAIVSTCDDDGCGQCKDGYKEPNCCDCDPKFFKAPDGTCKSRCIDNIEECNDDGCTCKDGFGGSDCCQCRKNSVSCTDKTCVCEPGFAPPLCCDCAPGYYRAPDGTCKDPCTDNVEICTDGVCTCKAGFGGADCCLCTKNAIECTGSVCECKPGYAAPDCCKCDSDFYRDPSGNCKESKCNGNVDACENEVCSCQEGYGPAPDCCFCLNNIVESSCTESGCQCKKGFKGDDCCTPECTGKQDIFFLVDATRSNRRPQFCQEIYAIELISRALSPRVGNDLSGTRIGTYLYPKSRSSSTESLTYFPVGKYDCSNTVNQFHRLMEAFTHDLFDLEETDTELYNLQKDLLRGAITVPVASIDLLTSIIKSEVTKNGANRRRIVIILTDGPPDDSEENVKKSVKKLVEAGGTSLTLIAAGIVSELSDKYNEFRDHVKLLANGNKKNSYLTPKDASTTNAGLLLGMELVNIMERNGAICDKQAKTIRQQLSNPDGNYYCDCNVFKLRPGVPDQCKKSCPSTLFNTGRDNCKTPPSCGATVESEDPGLVSLEEQIIAAVENVLVEEGIIEVE